MLQTFNRAFFHSLHSASLSTFNLCSGRGRFVVEEEQKESLQRENAGLQRQIQQLESGLQDLGREHQTMQMVQQRLEERRWEADRAVTHCRGCSKHFSLTTRRVRMDVGRCMVLWDWIRIQKWEWNSDLGFSVLCSYATLNLL